MRRLVMVIAGVVAICAFLPPAAHASQAARTSATAGPAPQGVGIRLVDIPTALANDPRARQYIIDHLAPGTTISRRVEVTNYTAKPQVVSLYAASATISGGSFLFGAGRAANELTSWTTVEPPTLTVGPGVKALATVTIAVPPNATSGERYGVIWAELAPAVPSGGGVTSINRVGVRIYLSVGSGASPATDFAITTLEARRNAGGRPEVVASVHNTGGRAVDLSGELQLTNGPGGLSAGPFPARLGTTLGLGQVEPVTVMLDPAIPAGPWDAHMTLQSGTTVREATARVTFPAAAATSAPPVMAQPPSPKGSGSLPLVLVVALLIAIVLLLVVLFGRRRRRRSPTG